MCVFVTTSVIAMHTDTGKTKTCYDFYRSMLITTIQLFMPSLFPEEPLPTSVMAYPCSLKWTLTSVTSPNVSNFLRRSQRVQSLGIRPTYTILRCSWEAVHNIAMNQPRSRQHGHTRKYTITPLLHTVKSFTHFSIYGFCHLQFPPFCLRLVCVPRPHHGGSSVTVTLCTLETRRNMTERILSANNNADILLH